MSGLAQLRMDGGKVFSTIHGERPPGDPHQHVHFYQDGLPFGADRKLLAAMIEGDDRLVSLATKKLARQKRQTASVPAVGLEQTDFTPPDVPDDEEDDDDDDNDINLEMWLTGEAKYIFGKIRATIADRYKKRGINNIENAVDFLVNEQRIVPPDRLSPTFQAMLKKAA
jgi:hypothetical protein